MVRVESQSSRADVFIRGGTLGKKLCEDTMRRRPLSQGETPQENQTSCPLDLGLPASRTIINFHCLSHPHCGILLH